MSSKSTPLAPISTGKSSHAFSNTELFSHETGYFSAPVSGVYFIAANLVIEKERKFCQYSAILTLNIDNKILENVYQSGTEATLFPIQIFISLYLNEGEGISIYIESYYSVISRVLKESTFSAILLSGLYSAPPGFTLEAQNSKMVIKQGWTSVGMDTLSDSIKGGRLDNTGYTITQNRFSVRDKAVYIYSSILKISSRSRLSGLKVALLINGIPIDTKDGTFVSSRVNVASVEFSVAMSLLLFLEKGDYVTVNIYNPFEGPWYIEKGSMFSLCKLQSFAPQFSQGLQNSPKISVGWIELTSWTSLDREINFNYAISYEKNTGRYHVLQSGIYYVNARLVFTSTDVTFIQTAIAIDGEPNRADGLSARKTNVVGSATLSIASVIKIRRRSYISVFLYLEGIKVINLDKISQFSLMLLANENSIVGFHSVLPSDVVINDKNKWIRITSFQTAFHNKPWIFNTMQDSIGKDSGILIPQSGIYLIFANLLVGRVDLLSSDSYYEAIISVDGQEKHQVLAVKQSTQYSAGRKDLKNEITLSIFSALKLRKGQIISVKLFSNLDNNFFVRKASGLSMFLVYPEYSKFANGFLVRKTNKITLGTSYIAGWSSIGKGGGRFTTDNSAVLIGGEQIKISISGMYIISFGIELTGSEAKPIRLGISLTVKSTTEKNLFCAKAELSSSPSHLGCQLMLSLEANSNLRVIVRTEHMDMEVGYSESGYLSAVLVRYIGDFPNMFSVLRNENGIHGLQQPIQDWKVLSKIGYVAYGEKKFDESSGTYFVPIGGMYILTLCLQLQTALISNEKFSLEIGSLQDKFNITLWMRTKQETLTVSRFLNTKTGTPVNIKITSKFPLNIGESTRISISFLPKRFHSALFFYKGAEDLVLKSGDSIKNFNWIHLKSGNRAKQRNFVLNGKSIYVLFFNLQGKIHGKSMRVYINFEKQRRKLLYFCNRACDNLFNTMVTRILITGDSTLANLEIDSRDKLNGILLSTSTFYLLNLGHVDTTSFTLTKTSERVTYQGKTNTWIPVIGYYLEHKQNMHYTHWKMLVKSSGLYILALNIILKVSRRTQIFAAIYGYREMSIIPGLFSSNEFETTGILSITATIHLDRGMIMQPVVKSKTPVQFSIEPGSSFSVALLENLETSIANEFGPVIVDDLSHSRIVSLEVGMKKKLECVARGEGPIQYYWYRDNVLLQFRSKEMVLTGHNLEDGNYYCEARIGNRRAISTSTHVNIFDTNECLTGAHNCSKENQTCVNTKGSFYCKCAHGYAFRAGICLVMHAEPGFQIDARSNTLPTAVRVLVPILCIVIFFVFVLSIYTCYKHQKSRSSDNNAETAAFTDSCRDFNREFDETPGGYQPGVFEMEESPIEDGGFSERHNAGPSPSN